jgi:hypothetical protein
MASILSVQIVDNYSPYEAYFNITPSSDTTSITVSIVGHDNSDIDRNTFTIYYVRFINLTPNHDYTVTITPRDANGVSGATSTYYFHTIPAIRWQWYTPKVSGGNFSLSAQEWNDFTNTINTTRQNKGLSYYWFTTVNSGDPFYFWIFNQAVTAISEMSPPTPTPSSVSSGQTIYASYLNGLRDSLNSIP